MSLGDIAVLAPALPSVTTVRGASWPLTVSAVQGQSELSGARDSPCQVSVSHFVPSKVVVMALKPDINQDTLWLKVLPGIRVQNMEFCL